MNRIRTATRLSPFLSRKGNVAKIASIRASRIKLPYGLNISRAVTTSAILAIAIVPPTGPIFIHFGGPQAHGHSPENHPWAG